MYVKTLGCAIIPTLLYLYFKVKFLVHKANLLYYTYSVVVNLRAYNTFNDTQNYCDTIHYRGDTTRDLLIMHTCDTFCDELILLHKLFQSTVIILLLSIPFFMKYIQ